VTVREQETQPSPEGQNKGATLVGVLRQQENKAEYDEEGKEVELKVLAATEEVIEVPEVLREGGYSHQQDGKEDQDAASQGTGAGEAGRL